MFCGIPGSSVMNRQSYIFHYHKFQLMVLQYLVSQTRSCRGSPAPDTPCPPRSSPLPSVPPSKDATLSALPDRPRESGRFCASNTSPACRRSEAESEVRSPRAWYHNRRGSGPNRSMTPVKRMGASSNPPRFSIYGGVNMDGQIKLFVVGPTSSLQHPGRLLDHMQRRTIDLSTIQILVLDEADRMLDMGFINDVRKVIAAVPRERQTMLFSATLSNEDHRSRRRTSSAIRTKWRSASVVTPAEGIDQHFYNAPHGAKVELLASRNRA